MPERVSAGAGGPAGARRTTRTKRPKSPAAPLRPRCNCRNQQTSDEEPDDSAQSHNSKKMWPRVKQNSFLRIQMFSGGEPWNRLRGNFHYRLQFRHNIRLAAPPMQSPAIYAGPGYANSSAASAGRWPRSRRLFLFNNAAGAPGPSRRTKGTLNLMMRGMRPWAPARPPVCSWFPSHSLLHNLHAPVLRPP